MESWTIIYALEEMVHFDGVYRNVLTSAEVSHRATGLSKLCELKRMQEPLLFKFLN